MRKPVSSTKKPATPSVSRSVSPWAVVLLVVSSGFALAAAVALSTGYVPF
jgi:adenine/guanine phosphoribosyltransferase-like PRPP-binding protein